jgi:RND family efflux transporter MFP subunit
MKTFAHHRFLYISVAIAAIAFIAFMAHRVSTNQDENIVTATVDIGIVRELVSVSGIAEAERTAELAFPVTGIIRTVEVRTGDIVVTGDVLATLDTRALSADRLEAVAAVNRAVADRNELLSGPTASAREVTTETLFAKEASLVTIIEDGNQKVANAYIILLSSNLTAYTNQANEEAVPPTISGTYSCKNEGTYKIDVFSSKADSGYSYKLSGIEEGTFTASVDQKTPIANCGLQIQFDTDSKYNRSVWFIDIPNMRSSQYVTNRNNYALAVTQSESAIVLARQDIAVARANASNQNAPARSEAVDRANAAIAQAQARLSRIDATISDRILTAPFDGVITNIDILPGETVGSEPIVNLFADNNFEITARIPEIDVGKLQAGQVVEMIFDARASERVIGDISFISPQATEIDGVAYYEAIVLFRTVPTWMRSGLNADIEIIILEESNSLRISKRFLIENETGYEVLVLNGKDYSPQEVAIVLEGNDGFVAISGLNLGDILVAP